MYKRVAGSIQWQNKGKGSYPYTNALNRLYYVLEHNQPLKNKH